ncbi:MAG: hypothetical protein WAL63_17840 [Solirubrobacteraceae bacterium]
MAPEPAQPTEASPWPTRLQVAATGTYEWLSRPRVTLAAAGLLLLGIGGLVATNSVWTLPLVIVGAIMVVVAWIGHRLEGRCTIEWGQAGTQLTFRATVKPGRSVPAGIVPPRGEAQALTAAPASDARIIDGEAHTVEVDVAELKALIAAAEAADSVGAGRASGGEEILIHRGVDAAARSSHVSG